MRPPEFTGGNSTDAGAPHATYRDASFNEAAGIHRRKLTLAVALGVERVRVASMRPPEFTGGNGHSLGALDALVRPCFNEAAGIHRRKPPA